MSSPQDLGIQASCSWLQPMTESNPARSRPKPALQPYWNEDGDNPLSYENYC
jgi:hypothetical protein